MKRLHAQARAAIEAVLLANDYTREDSIAAATGALLDCHDAAIGDEVQLARTRKAIIYVATENYLPALDLFR